MVMRTFEEYIIDISERLRVRFGLPFSDIDDIIIYYYDDIVDAFSGEKYINIDRLINSWKKKNKIQWR